MVTNGGNRAQPPAVLFSAGLDSAVLLAAALADGPAHPVYVRAGLFRTATNSGVNMGLVYAAIPAFAALTIWYSLLNLREDIRASQRGEHPHSAPPPAE